MTVDAAIALGSMLSVVLTALALGLSTAPGDITHLFEHPRQFAKSLLAIDIVMPAFVLATLAVTNLPEAIRIALAALSVSPVSPTIPEHVMKAGGGRQRAVGLLVAVSLIAFAFVPLSVEFLGKVRGIEAHVPASTVVFLMGANVLGPLIGGIVVQKFWPAFAGRAASPVSKSGNILLVLCLVAVLPGALPQIWSLAHDGALASVAGFALVGLAVGHLLGGPDPDHRSALAIGTASRHPGVAMAIAASSFPNEKLALPAILMYLLTSRLAAVPYLRWRKRQHERIRNAVSRSKKPIAMTVRPRSN